MIDESSKSALAIGKPLCLRYLGVERSSPALEADTALLCSLMAPGPLEEKLPDLLPHAMQQHMSQSNLINPVISCNPVLTVKCDYKYMATVVYE